MGRGSVSQAHMTHLRECSERGLRRDFREERGQIREGRAWSAILPEGYSCYLDLWLFFIGFFGLSEFFFVFFGTTAQRVVYKYIIFFFYLGFMDQFVNILGEGGQVYKFWDQMLKILCYSSYFLCSWNWDPRGFFGN